MYLAIGRKQGKTTYSIRESYRAGEAWASRTLFTLGEDPRDYIRYPGGNAFYIDEEVRDGVEESGCEYDYSELEDLFWNFVDPEIRVKLDTFRRKEKTFCNKKKAPPSTEAASRLHLFDKRRMHYLRFGHTDQGTLSRTSPKLFHRLFDKSRDELEQLFIEMESHLNIRERKTYVYVIFDLQRFFREIIAKTMPQGLPEAEVDRRFLEEICRLNQDAAFFSGMEMTGRLNDYLVRYVLFYFDHDYPAARLQDEYLREFINARRRFRGYPQKKQVSDQEASHLFGVSPESLGKMGRRDLMRRYRKLALKHHPDQGGSGDFFCRLTEAYRYWLNRKK